MRLSTDEKIYDDFLIDNQMKEFRSNIILK